MNFNFSSVYNETLKFILDKAPFKPELGLILGSGLGDFGDKINILFSIPTNEIPGYPVSTVEGHAGKILFGEYENKKLILFQGRIHFYEGYQIQKLLLPVFIASKSGCKRMFITNAAGGVSDDLHPGDLMVINSFNGFNIKKELSEVLGIPNYEKLKSFKDFPSKKFISLIFEASLHENIILKRGVYWYMKGPSYETPAEIKMIDKMGVDAVGMSTVHEAVFSNYLGMETASVSCITNYGAGISSEKLSHDDVTKTAVFVKDKFERLVKRMILMLPE